MPNLTMFVEGLQSMNRWLKIFVLSFLFVGCTPVTDTGGAGGSTAASGSLNCADGIQNGAETSVDCGGLCGPCALGKACGGASDCASEQCSDGVCCDAPCKGACVACVAVKTGAPDGVCTAFKVGLDPDAECAETEPSTCGALGAGCNGDEAAPACKVHPAGVSCGAAVCADGQVTSARACDGKGTCAPGTTADCAPAECGADAGKCAVSCTTNADCVVGFTCSLLTATCTPLGNTGGACSSAKDCTSGNCVDDVCCNMACDGGCNVCAKTLGASVNGACSVLPSGAPGSPECAPFVCAGGMSACPKTCATDAGCAPGNYCAGDVCVAKLGLASVCTAANQCEAGFCADGVCCDGACAGSCDVCKKSLGATKEGACTPRVKGSVGAPSCTPFVCDGSLGTCPKFCAIDADCSAGNFCGGNVCQPKKSNGGVCALTNECSSGLCVDKVCCNTACTGNCMACSVKNLEGTCSLVPDKLDPREVCVGHCDGMGSCAPPTWSADAKPILALKCGPCHTLNAAGGTNFAEVYADSQLVSKKCANQNVAQCSLQRIKNGEMPKGKNCTGDPVLDAANLDCLTSSEQETIQTWVMTPGQPE